LEVSLLNSEEEVDLESERVKLSNFEKKALRRNGVGRTSQSG